MEGIVVGIVRIEGMLGNGGKVSFGRVGMMGKLGSGESVGLGREGWVVGNVGCGRFGILGNGGNGGICRRLRELIQHVNANTTKKAVRMEQLKEAIIVEWMFLQKQYCCFIKEFNNLVWF